MMKMSKQFLSFAILGLAIINMASAADYTVGSPNGGWDQSTDLTAWASSITFFQGDNLLFRYTANHNVREVSKPDFDSCNGNNPLQPPYTDGATVIPLTSASTRYFMCGTAGHCLGGMKVAITTLAAPAPPPSPTPPAPSPQSSTTLFAYAPPPPPTRPAVPSPPPSTTPAVSSPPPSITPAVSSPPPTTTHPIHSPPPSTTPSVSSPPPSTTPAVPSPPPKHSPGHPVSSPPSKTTAPKPSKDISPPPSVVASPPSGSFSAPAPAPSSAPKFDAMGAITSLLLIIFLTNV